MAGLVTLSSLIPAQADQPKILAGGIGGGEPDTVVRIEAEDEAACTTVGIALIADINLLTS